MKIVSVCFVVFIPPALMGNDVLEFVQLILSLTSMDNFGCDVLINIWIVVINSVLPLSRKNVFVSSSEFSFSCSKLTRWVGFGVVVEFTGG